MTSLKSVLLFEISMDLYEPIHLGNTPAGARTVIAVRQGSFMGERLSGTVLPHASGDLLLKRADGSFAQDVRLVLRTNDDVFIAMTYRGVRHAAPTVSERIARGEDVRPDEYYLRIVPFFETASGRYEWLNDIVAVGIGARGPGRVKYSVFEIL